MRHGTITSMAVKQLTELLTLPADDRAQIAIALWESLSDTQRDEAFALTDEQRAELGRRRAEHQRNPNSAVPWSEVRKLLG